LTGAELILKLPTYLPMLGAVKASLPQINTPSSIGIPREGRLVRWDQGKGYGFIRPDDGGKDVFVHLSGLRGTDVPEINSRWVFTAIADPNGRGDRVAKAVPAQGTAKQTHAPASRIGGESIRALGYPGQPRGGRPEATREKGGRKKGGREHARQARRRDQTLRPLALNWRTLVVAAATLTCLVAASIHFDITGFLLAVYPLMSLVTYMMYARDKLSAIRGTWRIPESSLHLAELLGGWPGGYVAQQTMRHKTVKPSYQAVYWLIVMLHVGIAALSLVAPNLFMEIIDTLLRGT